MSNKENPLSDPKLIATVKKITGFTPTELADGLRDQIKNASPEERFKIAARTPSLAGVIYQMNEAEAKENRRAQVKKNPPIARPVEAQGDTRYLTQHRGLHTPTIQEIIADANKPDPTAPYFDTNSDHMRQINPLEPHWTFGDNPRLVNPLNPGPKMPTNG